MTKKILILGGSSYVGQHIFEKLGPKQAIATFHNNAISNAIRFDARDMSLSDILKEDSSVSHALILLGNTIIDSCAENRGASQHLNVDSIINIVQELVAEEIVPFFISSDNVFEGLQGFYSETDDAKPVNVYGEQKHEVETFIRKYCAEYCIVRLSKVYGNIPGDGTIFTDWAESLASKDLIKVTTDQIFSPITIDDVVEGLIYLVRQNARGIYHLCGPDTASRETYLDMLIKELGLNEESDNNILRCTMDDFALLERRPLNIAMVNDKFCASTGLKPKSVREILPSIVATYQNSQTS